MLQMARARLPTLSTLVIAVAVLASIGTARLPALFVSRGLKAWHADSGRRLEGDGADEEEGPGVWAGMVLAATLTKLSASVDDIVWLLPFVTCKEGRRKSAMLYLCCMQFVVLLAWAFTAGGEALLSIIMPKSEEWPLERVLELSSAVLLSLYTAKLFKEYFSGGDDGDKDQQEDGEHAAEKAVKVEAAVITRPAGLRAAGDDTDGVPALDTERGAGKQRASYEGDDCESFYTAESSAHPNPAVTSMKDGLKAAAMPSPIAPCPAAALVGVADGSRGGINAAPNTAEVPAVPAAGADSKYTLSKLCTIALFGSLDDFAVFVSLMLSGLFSAPQLSIGVLIGTTIVVTLCVGVGRFQCVVRFIERIPLFVIIGGFSVWTFISVFAS